MEQRPQATIDEGATRALGTAPRRRRSELYPQYAIRSTPWGTTERRQPETSMWEAFRNWLGVGDLYTHYYKEYPNRYLSSPSLPRPLVPILPPDDHWLLGMVNRVNPRVDHGHFVGYNTYWEGGDRAGEASVEPVVVNYSDNPESTGFYEPAVQYGGVGGPVQPGPVEPSLNQFYNAPYVSWVEPGADEGIQEIEGLSQQHSFWYRADR